MEVKKAEATASKTASTIDFSDMLDGLNKTQKKEVLDQVGELLIGQILESCANQTSPIDGSHFKPLSKEYAKKKMEETGSSDPNLDLTGDMLTALDYKIIGESIELGVYGKDEAGKADGHNNFSGESKLPTRQFLPKKNQLFDDSIVSIIQDAIDLYKADNIELNTDILESIGSSARLYDYLQSEFDGMSKGEIKDLVLQSDLANLLDKYDLLDML